MPYGVGGSAAEGLRSGFEMGLQAQRFQHEKETDERELQIRQQNQERLNRLEEDRYGRLKDETRMKALQTQLKLHEDILTKSVNAGTPVDDPRLDSTVETIARLTKQLEDMQQAVVQSPKGRLPEQTGSGLTERPNVASADMSGALPPTAAAPAPPTTDSNTPAAPGPAAAAMSTAPINAAPPQPGVADTVPGGAAPATVTAPQATAVNPAQKQAADLNQQAQDTASRLQMGQSDLQSVPDGDFALMMTAATGRHPSEIPTVHQHVMDWEAGMQTGNNGLMLRGLNGIFGPQIQAGVGGPSPYGGTITDKQIIGLDPAMSADGQIHPDKVIPRLRVMTDIKGDDGQPLHYDAPMTQNRSILPNDPVAAVSVQSAADRIGQLGTLLTTLDHPDAQAKLKRGASDPRVQQYMDAIRLAYHPADDTARKDASIQRYMHDHPGTTEDDAIAHMQLLGTIPKPVHETGAINDLDAAERLVKRGDAKNMQQAMDMIQRMTHPLPHVPAAPSAGSGLGTLPGTTTPTGETMTPQDFLKKLPAADRESVVDVAGDPSLLAGISIAKGRREHIQQLVSQFVRLQKANMAPGAENFQLGKGLPGITENGMPIGGADPSSVRFYALMTIGGNTTWQQGLSRGQDGVRFITQVKNAVPVIAKEIGLEPGDVGSNVAQNKALSATLQDRTKYSAAVDQLSGTMMKQAALVKSLLARGGATELGPLFNAPYNEVRKALGSTGAKDLDNALIGLGREHQRVLVSPLSNAQLAVQAQQTGDKLMSLNMTPSQIISTIDNVMTKEVENAKAQAKETNDDVANRLRALTPKMNSGMSSAPTAATRISSDDEFNKLASGAHFIGPDGLERIKP